MPLPYREVYDRWQRSKSFGDPRDLVKFSTDLNEVTGTRDFDAGVNAGWWTRASHAADVGFFEPVARATGLEAAGRGIGGLFGPRGAEIGEQIGRATPRMVAQTVPLIAAEIASAGTATPFLVPLGAAATGGLFGAHTYAETGSPTAAAISGVTAAALPAAGRVGGAVGRAALGPSKWTSLAGSQAGLLGAQIAGGAAQAKALGQPFDPLSPEFLAQQIPFSLLDIGRTALARPRPVVPQALHKKPATYVPPKGEPVAEANMQDMLDRMVGIAKDQNVTPEAKSKAFGEVLGAVMESPAVGGAPREDRVILIGHPKQMESGSVKLFATQSKYYDLPEHANVFINNPESATQFVNPDGSVTFITNRKNVSSNVKYPSRPEDFPALRQQRGQVQLPEKAFDVATAARQHTIEQVQLESRAFPEGIDATIKPLVDAINDKGVFTYGSNDKRGLTYVATGSANLDMEALPKNWSAEARPDGSYILRKLDTGTPINENDIKGIQKAISLKSGIDPKTDLLSLRQKFQQTVKNETVFQAALGKEPKDPDAAVAYWTQAIEQMTPAHLKPGYVSPFDAGEQQVMREAGVEPAQVEAAVQTMPPVVESALPPFVREEMLRRGLDPNRPLNDVDLQNPSIREAIMLDPDLTGEQRDLLLRTGSLKVISPVEVMKASAQKIEVAQQTADTAQQKIDTVPRTVEEARDLMGYGDEASKSVLDTVTVVAKAKDIVGQTELEARARKAAILLGVETDPAMTATALENVARKIVSDDIKAKLTTAQKEGATPTQAVEKLRLQTQTPIVDKNKQQINLSQEDLRDQLHEQLLALSAAAKPVEEPLINPKTGKPVTGETAEERELLREEANKRLKAAGLPTGRVSAKEGFPEKPQAIYGEPIRDENGKNFKTRELAEAFRDADPDLEGYVVRDAGKKKGFYLAKQVNVEASLEGEPGRALENVLEVEDIRDVIVEEAATTQVAETQEIFTPQAETRPEVSFNDYLSQLDLASQNPVRLRNAAGFDDLPTAITAIRQFRTALTDVFAKGKEGLKEVNAALKKAGILTFESEKEMQTTFKKMRSGLEEFTGKFRSFALDSRTPHDPQLVAEMGVLHPTNGANNFLDWFILNQPSGLMRDLAVGLRKFANFSPITNEEGKGFWYDLKTRVTNLSHLPASREDALNVWGPRVMHELAHDTVRDLKVRTDPAAMEFKSTLQRVLKTLRESKQLPAEVRKAVNLAVSEKWYGKGAEDYNARYDKVLPGRETWKGVHYSLLNEYELLSGIFDSPELVRIMQNTTMPRSPISVLNFFAEAWARMFGYTPNASNAFAKLLSSYDNYLSGTRNARGYNGMSYIRDSLVAVGVAPQQMSSRLNGVSETYAKGDLSSSISAFEREMTDGLLPATTVAGPLNSELKAALVTGDVKTVGELTDGLLAEEVPQHRSLWLRLKDDLVIAKNLYDEAQKGNLYAEVSLFQEGLKNQFSKLNAMENALDKYDAAAARWETMDALGNSEGIQRLWSRSLKGETPPNPTEQTGNEDIARQALGLEAKGAEYITAERRRLAATGEKTPGWLEKMFKFTSFVEQEQPAFKPVYQNMLESQANAHRRMAELEVVRNSDGLTKGWNKTIANANKRVAETPGLNQIVSDMLRRANVLEKMRKPVTLADDEMQEAVRRASDAKRRDGRSDRQDVITAFNSESARAQHRVDKVIPEHLEMANKGLTAISIIGREIGMPSKRAVELAEQLYGALKQLRDPAQQIQGAETLRVLSTQMQPETFLKVMEQTNGFIDDANRHSKLLQRFRHYTGEQRYGKFHLVMSREGEPYREGFMTEKAARVRAKELQSDGWVLEDVVPIQQANVAGYLRTEDPVIASQRELDQQTLNRLESVISDLPQERQELLRPLVQRAAEYEASAAAFSPVPTQASPRRKFRAGRETIDMMANAAEETKRTVNWMRHRESRILTAVHMLDPEMLANRSLKEYSRQFVDNQLAADNPIARRFNEAAFYWYLAGNFGNDVLESMQTLTTGMASLISETGSVRDALKYITGASSKVFKRYATGKWGDPNTEWFINWLAARGSLGLPTWGDVFDPTTQNFFDVTAPKTAVGKSLDAVKKGLRGYKSLFLRHNDMVGALAGFQLGRELGMTLEDSARFAEGVKNRGLYSGGKVQRPVGMFSIKEKAVPQLMGSLKTYVMGWFSQLAHNYKVGFAGAPGDFTPAQRTGAKKAFVYMLGAQATLAGSLGLPGIGQALALMKQTTGLDIKGWTRKNLAAMFGEDQDDYGGFMTGLALHGLLSQAAPFDISGRQITDVPFTGVSSWKGFDLSNIMPVPFSMTSDFLTGIMALAKGGDPSKAFPIALRGPAQLVHGSGDIRNSRGELLYRLSPSERFFKTLGLEPSRVAAAKETAATIKSMNEAAEARKTASVSAVADLYRRGDTQGAQKRLADIHRENPSYDMRSFVRSVALAVEKQTFPYDWKREVNPALDIVGLGSGQPSRELERLHLRQGVAAGLGLYEPPRLRSAMRAASVDELMNSDPYTTRASALQRLLTARQLRSRNISLTPEEFQ